MINSGRREIHEVEAESDYVATLLTYYEAIITAIDRWISVSWTFASIFVPANMVLAGIVVSTKIDGILALSLSLVCLVITICWGLLWYRTYMFNLVHLDQLADIEAHLCKVLGISAGLCPQITFPKRSVRKFGWRTRLIRIRYIIAIICAMLTGLWLTMFVKTLTSLI